MATQGSGLPPRKVPVTAAAVLISQGGARTVSRKIRNLGVNEVFLGSTSTVTATGATQGWQINANADGNSPLQDYFTETDNGPIYAICSAGETADVLVWEVEG